MLRTVYLGAATVLASALVGVRPIAPPAKPLPDERASAGITRFSFIAYGDTRSSGNPSLPGDGDVIHPVHSALVDLMVEKIKAFAGTRSPIRFVVQSGDAVLRGQSPAMWNVSFSPIIERLTRGAGLPYFFAVGNHDVTTMPPGDPGRALGLSNTLAAIGGLIPPEGSLRRLNGYATYAFGYGNFFGLVIDSNIASDEPQLAWVTHQLEGLDRKRFPLVVALFHHPPFSSGPHGGPTLEIQSQAIRDRYLPLFRRHHVRMTITGHDHLFDHFVEHYTDHSGTHRRDDIVTGGGGAPTYTYAGEPDLSAYLAHGAAQRLRVDHLFKPGTSAAENPHHFLVVQIDGDRLAIVVIGLGPGVYPPYDGRSRIELTDRTR